MLSAILNLKHRIPFELRSQAVQGEVSTKVGDRLGKEAAYLNCNNIKLKGIYPQDFWLDDSFTQTRNKCTFNHQSQA
ncbi:hypothetical protein pb186bvf_005212 [Paramecium bursaria]